jgi:outer membrane cobalamin receptor
MNLIEEEEQEDNKSVHHQQVSSNTAKETCKEQQQQEDPWHQYRYENKLNETIITLRLTKKHYRTAYTLAHMLGYKSLDDYVSYIVMQNLEMEVRGEVENDIDKSKLF